MFTIRRCFQTLKIRRDAKDFASYVTAYVAASFSDVIYENPRYKPSTFKEDIAIYCVHGTGDRNNAFSNLIENIFFDEKGLPENISSACLSTFYGRFQGNTIEFFAEQLLEKIVAKKHKNVVLMGHSRGGLVVSHLAACLAAAAEIRVHCVISICSPFMGCDLAMKPFTWISGSLKEMQPGSVFLRELRAKISVSTTQYFYFAAEEDSVVNPESCCIPESRHLLKIIEGKGHLSGILSSKDLFDHVRICIEDTVNVILAETKEGDEVKEASTVFKI